MFGIKLIPSQGHEWYLIQTGQNQKAQIDGYS